MALPRSDSDEVGQDGEGHGELRLLPRFPRAAVDDPVLDGPFTETKEICAGRGCLRRPPKP